MNKTLIITLTIALILSASGCLEETTPEYKKGYKDGYESRDTEQLECVIAYYNKCIDVSNANPDHYRRSHIRLVQYDNLYYSTLYEYQFENILGDWVNIRDGGNRLFSYYPRMTDEDYEIYCYGYLIGVCDYNTKQLKYERAKNRKKIESELENMSRC